MSHKNKNISAARVAGGALVALSGFVPIPQMAPSGTFLPGSAHAASLAIPVTGKFITGVTLSQKSNLKFGKFVATKAAGNFAIKGTADAATANVEAKVITAPARGKFGIKLAVDLPIDVKVSKIGSDLTLNNSAGGVKQVPTGGFSLSKVNFIGAFKAGVNKTLTSGGATFNTLSNVTIKFAQIKGAAGVATGSDNTATFAAGIKWAGSRPVGAITNGAGGNIVLTVTY